MNHTINNFHQINYLKTKMIDMKHLAMNWKDETELSLLLQEIKTEENGVNREENGVNSEENGVNSEENGDINNNIVKKMVDIKYEPFAIHDLQQYNPIYSLFFDLTTTNYNSISLNHKYHIKNLKEIVDTQTNETIKKNIFVKFAPLLDPLRYMIGKYDISNTNITALPTPFTQDKTHSKLNSVSNASYVDCFFYFLSSILLNDHQFPNGIDFYGSFLGNQEKFKINVEDDLEYLNTSSFFHQHLNKLFFLDNLNDEYYTHEYGNGSRNYRRKIQIIEDNVENIEIFELPQQFDAAPINLHLQSNNIVCE
jgi:hypothetical protein